MLVLPDVYAFNGLGKESRLLAMSVSVNPQLRAMAQNSACSCYCVELIKAWVVLIVWKIIHVMKKNHGCLASDVVKAIIHRDIFHAQSSVCQSVGLLQ